MTDPRVFDRRAERMSVLAAVLFDLDGTLLDTVEDIGDSVNTVLAAHGFPTHDCEAYKLFVGDGVEMLVERALPGDRRDEDFIAACSSAVREEYGRR